MMNTMKLFCIPHAGGLASSYYRWKGKLGKDIEVIPLELAGRGSRGNIPLYDDMDSAIEDIYNLMIPHLNRTQFAILGHSMGSILAYEIITKLRARKGIEPIHMFFSGQSPIHVMKEEHYHTFPDRALKNYIIELGGIPKEVCECDEILDMFLPMIRSDFKVVETYKCKRIIPCKCDISILYGEEDKSIDLNRINEWKIYTESNCNFYKHSSGHFFIYDHEEEILKIIKNALEKR